MTGHVLSLMVFMAAITPAYATDASVMWGTAPNGSTFHSARSAATHAQDGIIAGQVNAAQAGLLYSNGGSINVTSVGSQSIITTTIDGDNNIADIDATQTSTNSGDVKADNKFIRN